LGAGRRRDGQPGDQAQDLKPMSIKHKSSDLVWSQALTAAELGGASRKIVAQTGSLPCRRLATCDTADCQSALQNAGGSPQK
jgi:hypothetical protein